MLGNVPVFLWATRSLSSPTWADEEALFCFKLCRVAGGAECSTFRLSKDIAGGLSLYLLILSTHAGATTSILLASCPSYFCILCLYRRLKIRKHRKGAHVRVRFTKNEKPHRWYIPGRFKQYQLPRFCIIHLTHGTERRAKVLEWCEAKLAVWLMHTPIDLDR